MIRGFVEEFQLLAWALAALDELFFGDLVVNECVLRGARQEKWHILL